MHRPNASAPDPPRGGWLCPTDEDRDRLVDNSPAVRRARRQLSAVLGCGVVASAPWVGWLPIVCFVVAAVPVLGMDHFMPRVRYPERLSAGVQLQSLIVIVVGIGVSGGVRSPFLPWIALPAMTAAARFRPRVFAVALGVTVAVTAACVLITSAHAVSAGPAPLITTAALLAGMVIQQNPILDAEHRWRRDAVLDSLTGLLNRQGLEQRFAELAEQARLVGAPVSIVLFDVDRFKVVNDTHGHARGDDVLTSVADILRRQLRSFELLYRLGGDELLLLLPGADLEAAHGFAEQARLAVQSSRPSGLPVTVSIGVSCAEGDEIRLVDMYEAADRSLYEAKRNGRNAVYLAAAAGADAGDPAAVA